MTTEEVLQMNEEKTQKQNVTVKEYFQSADFDQEDFYSEKNWDFYRVSRSHYDTYKNLKKRPHRSHKPNGICWHEFCDLTRTMTNYQKNSAMGETLWVKRVAQFDKEREENV